MVSNDKEMFFLHFHFSFFWISLLNIQNLKNTRENIFGPFWEHFKIQYFIHEIEIQKAKAELKSFTCSFK
jgi:hypothetical protein